MGGPGEHERRFRALYDASYRPVLAYSLRRADNQATAEDVVAETFLIAWRRIDEVPTGDETLPWLLGVARRVLANARRGDTRRDRLLGRLRQHRVEVATEVEEQASAHETETAILAALDRIRPADAEVLKLAAWEGLTHAQIAIVLDCSVNAVAIRVHRARASLRAEVEKGPADSGHPLVTRRTPTGDSRTEWTL